MTARPALPSEIFAVALFRQIRFAHWRASLRRLLGSLFHLHFSKNNDDRIAGRPSIFLFTTLLRKGGSVRSAKAVKIK